MEVNVCVNEIFLIIRNIISVVAAIFFVSFILLQSRIILGCVKKNNNVLYEIIIPPGSGGYNNDVLGLYGLLIMWRFNRELRKDKETLAACRGAYNVYLSLIAGFVLSAVFLVVSFSLC